MLYDFKVFKDTVENDGEIKAIVAKGAAEQYTQDNGCFNRIY